MLRQGGFERLAKKEYEASIGERAHADALTGRILLLDGLRNLQDLGEPYNGEDVREALKRDPAAERGAQATIKAGIAACEAARDGGSREGLTSILDDTGEHVDFLETQLELTDKVGLQNDLQHPMADTDRPCRREAD